MARAAPIPWNLAGSGRQMHRNAETRREPVLTVIKATAARSRAGISGVVMEQCEQGRARANRPVLAAGMGGRVVNGRTSYGASEHPCRLRAWSLAACHVVGPMDRLVQRCWLYPGRAGVAGRRGHGGGDPEAPRGGRREGPRGR